MAEDGMERIELKSLKIALKFPAGYSFVDLQQWDPYDTDFLSTYGILFFFSLYSKTDWSFQMGRLNRGAYSVQYLG